MNAHKTPFELSGDIKDLNEVWDQSFEVIKADFEADATLPTVPLGMALIKFSTLLLKLDALLYWQSPMISEEDARKTIKWASELMDKKFDIQYQQLPQ